MPRKKRITKNRKGYEHRHLLHYFFGHDFFGEGFGREVTPEIEAEMKETWPLLRDKVFKLARERVSQRGFVSLPAYWWLYESPEPRNKDITEAEQLKKMGYDISDILWQRV